MALFEILQNKIKSPGAAAEALKARRVRGERIVFTNGCFDLLHYGHLHYLAEARDLGDCLVVGVNGGASVNRLKGPTRPINDEKTRTHMLAALSVVDMVVVFDTDTPLELIRGLEPDILVKGGDWKPEQIVGADLVLDRGGRVLSLPFVEGYSTTNIERRILELHGCG